MASLGHNVSWVAPGQSVVQGITRDSDGVFHPASDPRKLDRLAHFPTENPGPSYTTDNIMKWIDGILVAISILLVLLKIRTINQMNQSCPFTVS